jgi:hypothetical protein
MEDPGEQETRSKAEETNKGFHVPAKENISQLPSAESYMSS